MNRLIKKFKERNPNFNGKVSLIGHSLGSVICYDLLSHQNDQLDDTLNKDMQKNLNEDLTSPIFEETESLDSFLSRLNLAEFKNLFVKEKVTMRNMVF